MTIKRVIKELIPPIIFSLYRQVRYSKAILLKQARSEKEIASSYFCEVLRRSYLPYDKIELLAENIDNDMLHAISSTNGEPVLYGSFRAIAKYINPEISYIISPKNFFLQHGIAYELTDWMRQKKEGINFVWSSYIRELYREVTDNQRIYAVGAPFFYAKSLMSQEQLENEKNRLGKNLLAFPLHSTHYYDIDFDSDNFIKLLKEQQKRFDTVRVCLYWKDIQRGLAEAYIKAGFECVCCGHINDVLFLQRQRSLFEIADATISNGLGSYIGYSVYLNIPHWLVNEDYEIKNTNGNEAEELTRLFKEITVSERIYKAFGDNSDFIITKEQREIVDLLWGVSDIKTPEEMNDLLMRMYNQQ